MRVASSSAKYRASAGAAILEGMHEAVRARRVAQHGYGAIESRGIAQAGAADLTAGARHRAPRAAFA